MAVFPVAPGSPDYASNSSSGFIPAIWSPRIIENFYSSTCLSEISNTSYEGEIKAHGDSVEIRTDADITINNYVKGQALDYQNPESPKVTLKIDKGKYWGAAIDSVDKYQSDINLLDRWSATAGTKTKLAIETDVFAAVYADVAAANKGATAGAITSGFNLGATSAPLALTKSTILDAIVDAGTVLDENAVPEEGRFLLLPAWAAGMIKKSDLKDASLSGDGKSLLRNGRLGQIDRFTIYSNNQVASVTDGSVKAFHCVFGHNYGLTFATQMTEMETLKNPNAFGDLIRGLQVFGYKVVKGQVLGDLYVYKG